jgi:hypothetical protein
MKQKPTFKTFKNKLPEKTADELKLESHNRLLNFIITETYARYLGISEHEYLKKIGFENSGMKESKAVKVAALNILTDMTRLIFDIEDDMRQSNATFKQFALDNDLVEKDKENK